MNLSFLKRSFIAIFIVILILAMSFLGRGFLYLSLLVLSSISIYELNRAFNLIGLNPNVNFNYFFNVIFLTILYYSKMHLAFPITIFAFILLFASVIFNDKLVLNDLLASIFFMFYISGIYGVILEIQDSKIILLGFGLAAMTDTFAYIIGVLFGKHKLIERLSPKKTVEGAIGGIFGALIFMFIFDAFFEMDFNILFKILVPIIGSILGQIGDLAASYIKRKSGLKDFGFIFHSHGGVMDRFDSTLFIMPFIILAIQL